MIVNTLHLHLYYYELKVVTQIYLSEPIEIPGKIPNKPWTGHFFSKYINSNCYLNTMENKQYVVHDFQSSTCVYLNQKFVVIH